jgi:hypothetical protein
MYNVVKRFPQDIEFETDSEIFIRFSTDKATNVFASEWIQIPFPDTTPYSASNLEHNSHTLGHVTDGMLEETA